MNAGHDDAVKTGGEERKRRIGPAIAIPLTAVLFAVCVLAGWMAFRWHTERQVKCLKNLYFTGMYLDSYLGDTDRRAKDPMPEGTDALHFIVQMEHFPHDQLVCPQDKSAPSLAECERTGYTSYDTWSREDLAFFPYEVIRGNYEEIPLIWERTPNHQGKHHVWMEGFRRLTPAELERALARGRELIRKARESRQAESK